MCACKAINIYPINRSIFCYIKSQQYVNIDRRLLTRYRCKYYHISPRYTSMYVCIIRMYTHTSIRAFENLFEEVLDKIKSIGAKHRVDYRNMRNRSS